MSNRRIALARKQMQRHAQFTWTRTHFLGLGGAAAVVVAGVVAIALSSGREAMIEGSTGDVAGDHEEVRMDSPMATVRTQMEALQGVRDGDFRRTFVPDLQDDLTSEALSGCRDRILNSPAKPAWYAARQSQDEEHHRLWTVSIYGHDVGFHEVKVESTKTGTATVHPGKTTAWLADAIWCLPESARQASAR